MATNWVDRLSPRPIKLIGAILVGFSVGSVLPPHPAATEAAGLAPGLFLAGLGVTAGGAVYVIVPRLLDSSGCECDGECGCST